MSSKLIFLSLLISVTAVTVHNLFDAYAGPDGDMDMKEFRDFWYHFDENDDGNISKQEFDLGWQMAHFDDADRSPLFFLELDRVPDEVINDQDLSHVFNIFEGSVIEHCGAYLNLTVIQHETITVLELCNWHSGRRFYRASRQAFLDMTTSTWLTNMCTSGYLALITWAAVGIITVNIIHVSGDPLAHLDLFHHGDTNNDTALTMAECSREFMRFDVDADGAISKVEFILKWTYANLMDHKHAPLFFRLVDNDFNGYISETEIANLCKFFDDDENGKISEFEFDFSWKGMFHLTSSV